MMKMKPRELLSKIEEVAGTALYETRRLETLDTLKKKEMKLNEIEIIISKDIQPNLDRIKEQRQNQLHIKQMTDDIEKYGKIPRILSF